MLSSLSKWRPGTIRTRIILLILVGSVVSLGVGYEGLLQAERSSAKFEEIFEERVVSTGYLKDVQAAYNVQIMGAMIKYADGLLSASDSLTAVEAADASIAETWPKFVARQTEIGRAHV